MATTAADGTGTGILTRAAFMSAFPALRTAILAEWSEVDEPALAATGGELDKVVALLAERTTRTKALLRRQLEELYRVVTQPLEPLPDARPEKSAAADGAEKPPQMDQIVEELERRMGQLIRELRGGLLDNARDRVKENVFFSLLVALGFGFIVGVVFYGSSSRGRGRGD